MKTAISLPDDLFDAINIRARTLKVSRSALLAQAARAFLSSSGAHGEATEAWNRAIRRGGQPSEDPGSALFMKATKAVVRKAARRQR
jgi:predicted transcriptional regulator